MEGGGESSAGPKRKWKKKKSLIATAKKYGKKEWWGRGANIPEDMYHYLVGILEVMKNGFSSSEEKCSFVNNVLERTVNEEITLSSNQLGCRIIEELLPFSNPEDLERFINVFSEELRTICTDKYASFVLQQLITVCCNRGSIKLLEKDDGEPSSKKRKKESSEIVYSKEHIANCYAFAIKVSKYLLNNLEDFVWDVSANNILRTDIKSLGGVVVAPCEKPKQNLFKKEEDSSEVKHKPKHLNELEYKDVPEEFKEIVEEIANRLMMWPQFPDMPYDTSTSGLLQVLVYALGNTNKKLSKAMCKKLLDASFAPDACMNVITEDEKKDSKDAENLEENNQNTKLLNLPPVFDSEPAVRLLEAVLKVARSKIYTQIYAKCFINRLVILASMPGLNFTVQRLFDNCMVKEEFEPMFDEISDKFDKILVCGNTGVIAAVAKACLRLQSKQVKFIQAMENALECTAAENHKYFILLCARLLPLNRIDMSKVEEPYFINIHGSVVLQTMLSFQRPKKVIDSLLAMSQRGILNLFCDAKGCHIADSLFEGQFVGVKSREYLTRRLKGTYQELAISKYGSRALEKIFGVSSIEMKKLIMEELSNKSQLLNSTMFGQLISNNLKVDLYKKSFQSWKTAMDKESKVKEVFKDIIAEK